MSKKNESPPTLEKDVYVRHGIFRSTHRRVIGIIGDRIVYCYGGNVNRSCKLETFARWARKAVRVK